MFASMISNYDCVYGFLSFFLFINCLCLLSIFIFLFTAVGVVFNCFKLKWHLHFTFGFATQGHQSGPWRRGLIARDSRAVTLRNVYPRSILVSHKWRELLLLFNILLSCSSCLLLPLLVYSFLIYLFSLLRPLCSYFSLLFSFLFSSSSLLPSFSFYFPLSFFIFPPTFLPCSSLIPSSSLLYSPSPLSSHLPPSSFLLYPSSFHPPPPILLLSPFSSFHPPSSVHLPPPPFTPHQNPAYEISFTFPYDNSRLAARSFNKSSRWLKRHTQTHAHTLTDK